MNPRFQRSGLLFILLTLDEDKNHEVASVLGDPAGENPHGDVEWCNASLDEIGVDLLFDTHNVDHLSDLGELARAPSLLVIGHMVGEDVHTQDGEEYDEHFDLVSVHRVTTMTEVRRALAPMMTAQLTQTKRQAEWRNMECVFNVIRRGCR